MENRADSAGKPPSRREAFKKVGKFVIPTLVTFQVTALKVRASVASMSLDDLDAGNPYGQ